MELRHLRYFLAVADELNFTRAARRLHIAQPPLTRQIQALENELGLRLFNRTRHRVELTDAGRAFAAEAARILGELRSAVLSAQRTARGFKGQVRVGFTESASFNPLVIGAFRRFRADHPQVEVSLEEAQSTTLAAALREGRVDAAFVRPPLRQEQGLTLKLIDEEDMVVALPGGHRLARRRVVRMEQLADEAFILYPRAVRPGLADAVVAACERAGFVPKVAQYAPQLSSTLNLVAGSIGISIVPRSMQGVQPRSVRYVQLEGGPVKAQLAIAHRASESSAAVLNFVRTVHELAAARERGAIRG